MDPVTHTLVGASLAQTGLKRRTALGTATLIIGANAPDIDVLAYFWGSEAAVWFRRGITHGVLALIVLPLVLTVVILLLDRLRRRGGSEPPGGSAKPRQVLLLASIAIATHPLLDFLNTYGMRWLAPFSWKWFYGDTLFIIDPWVWALLAGGIWLSRNGAQWAKSGLAIATAYTLLMGASNVAARRVVRGVLAEQGVTFERMMVAPLAVTPFSRWVVVEDSEGYRGGLLRWLPRPHVSLEELPLDKEATGEALARAAADPTARLFLSWARFPYYVHNRLPDQHVVFIGDARYTLDPEYSWAATRVTVEKAVD
jgi:inner membrane protein